MENQPRDESRAATVREGGSESWSEAGEFIDDPSRLPTARGSSTPSESSSATSTGTGSSGASTGQRGTPTGGFQATTGHHETRSPRGNDFSSSDAPIGQGSNTPVGDEPDSYENWDSRQPAPGSHDAGMMSYLQPNRSFLQSFGGLLATLFAGGLAFAWWRRRQARQTRYARLQQMLMTAGLAAGGELPRMIGQAAAQSRSAWLPFLLLPIGLWLRERGKTGQQASEDLLEPLDLERRGSRLARQGSDAFEAYTRRWLHDVDPGASHGWNWAPILFTGAVAGGGYYAYRNGWLRWPSAMIAQQASSRTGLVRDVMSTNVETVTPDTTVADAARRMRDLDVGSLPVWDGTRLLGMVTDRDLTVRSAAAGKHPSSTPVREVMSPEVTWVFDHEPAEMAASVMRRRQIRRLPVLDNNDRLVGIVALADLATDLSNDRLKGETLEDISEPSGGRRR